MSDAPKTAMDLDVATTAEIIAYQVNCHVVLATPSGFRRAPLGVVIAAVPTLTPSEVAEAPSGTPYRDAAGGLFVKP